MITAIIIAGGVGKLVELRHAAMCYDRHTVPSFLLFS